MKEFLIELFWFVALLVSITVVLLGLSGVALLVLAGMWIWAWVAFLVTMIGCYSMAYFFAK